MRPAPELSNQTRTTCIKLNLFAELPFTAKLVCYPLSTLRAIRKLELLPDISKSQKPRGPRLKIASQRSEKKLERASLGPIENEFLASRSSFELPSRPQTWEFPARSQAATSTLSPRCVHRKWISADASGSHLRLFDLGSENFPKMPKKSRKNKHRSLQKGSH